jgi:hypothetical protein
LEPKRVLLGDSQITLLKPFFLTVYSIMINKLKVNKLTATDRLGKRGEKAYEHTQGLHH